MMLTKFLEYGNKKLHALAGWLQRKTYRLSRRVQRAGLILFCVVSAGFCTLVIWRHIRAPDSIIFITPIRVPRAALVPETPVPRMDSSISRQVVGIVRRLDSLKNSPGGQGQYDSLVKARPHLLDSLHLLQEQFFHFSNQSP